jgi:hypothetical protein
MRNKDLIATLQKLDPEMEVCIFDYKKMFNSPDTDEATSDGIYSKFDIDLVPDHEGKEFIALLFDNGDEDILID